MTKYLPIIILLLNLIFAHCDNYDKYDNYNEMTSIENKIIDWYERTSINNNWSHDGIYFNSYITIDTANNLINKINKFSFENKTHIIIILNTDGGDLQMTYKIISHMDEIRNNKKIKFHCVCIKAFSSGFFIFQLCDYRYWIDTYSIIMTHEPILTIQGTFRYVKTYTDNYNGFILDYQNYQTILERICTKSNINMSTYQNQINKKDWYIMSGIEIRKLNLADFYLMFM